MSSIFLSWLGFPILLLLVGASIARHKGNSGIFSLLLILAILFEIIEMNWRHYLPVQIGLNLFAFVLLAILVDFVVEMARKKYPKK